MFMQRRPIAAAPQDLCEAYLPVFAVKHLNRLAPDQDRLLNWDLDPQVCKPCALTESPTGKRHEIVRRRRLSGCGKLIDGSNLYPWSPRRSGLGDITSLCRDDAIGDVCRQRD